MNKQIKISTKKLCYLYFNLQLKLSPLTRGHHVLSCDIIYKCFFVTNLDPAHAKDDKKRSEPVQTEDRGAEAQPCNVPEPMDTGPDTSKKEDTVRFIKYYHSKPYCTILSLHVVFIKVTKILFLSNLYFLHTSKFRFQSLFIQWNLVEPNRSGPAKSVRFNRYSV